MIRCVCFCILLKVYLYFFVIYVNICEYRGDCVINFGCSSEISVHYHQILVVRKGLQGLRKVDLFSTKARAAMRILGDSPSLAVYPSTFLSFSILGLEYNP